MFRTRRQSTTSYPLSVLMVSSTDHSTPQTGKTVTCTISKNGGAFASSAGSVTELSSGIYTLAGNATDRNTLGSSVYKFSATGCDDAFVQVEIVPYDVFATGIDANLVQIAGATVAASGSGTITFARGQTVANGSNFPTNFASLVLTANEANTGYEVIAQKSTIFGTVDANLVTDAYGIASHVLATTNGAATVATQLAYLDAAVSGVGGSGAGITVIDSADAILTTTSPTTDSDNGTVTIYTGAAYTGTGEGITKSRSWTGDSLDGATATLYVVRQDLYEDPSDATAWTALDTATIAQTGTTIAVAFNPSDTATAALEWGLDGSGQTIYRAHVVIAASKKPLWDFPLIVKRGEWA